ncbi:PDZ domain-containing protein [Nocardioides marmoriginsengisoli]|uniref:PDZ domain-containing protein n=1 Tax=Nocardioides marmoriginsengisoli TaxID=661483 RepID=A0A3N0CSE0_9ACTN|nr:trypsin-like peptidase domain-containing protein [Nocardioides marmoriginsengisoli]RNL66191.1 PDZ domain-containing protein [Nocardioides marmoriginsengisoli]
MSDTDNTGPASDDAPAGFPYEAPIEYEPTTPYELPEEMTPPGGDETRADTQPPPYESPYGVQPAVAPYPEQTPPQPYAEQPTYAGQPQYQQQYPPQQAWGAPVPPPYLSVPAPPKPERARVPGWTWPLVSVLALLLGIGGGFLGGTLANDDNNSSGGVLKVERRTAQPLPDDNASVATVAQKLLPSTVQIVAEFGGRAQGATGSGFVFDKQGHVITNNHVVAEAAEDDGPIDVIDQDGVHHKATVVGRSPVYDLAVLKVDDSANLQPAAIGSADQMRVGETVIAFGSPLSLSASVTSGIISAVHRPVSTGDGDDASFINAIQTDAAINPGNSGGPLANLQGEVIGVNSAIATLGASAGQEGSNIGIGFAIPIEQVQVTADQILRTGKAQYPVIGVSVRGTEGGGGAEVKEITAGTPAASSDLKVGDVITAVDGDRVTNQTDVVVAIRSHLVTDTVELTVKRGSKTLKIKVGLVAKTG